MEWVTELSTPRLLMTNEFSYLVQKIGTGLVTKSFILNIQGKIKNENKFLFLYLV